MDDKNFQSIIIDQQQKQIEKQQEMLKDSISTIQDIVKGFQKTTKFIVVISAVLIFSLFTVFFVQYFNASYSEEIKQSHSNYNYNENINKNIGNERK